MTDIAACLHFTALQVVPKARYESVVVEAGVGLTKCAMAISSSCDGPAKNSGLSAVGEIRLVPDRSTESRVPWYVYVWMGFADQRRLHATPTCMYVTWM